MIDISLFDNLKRVALAVSGGKDSIALLYEMARHFTHDFFYVVNIEHGIRGEESINDSNFVKEVCDNLGVECKMYSVDAVKYSSDNGYTLEQGARLLRREIFEEEVNSGRADRVAVAHHMDDNVESILMHIFRGTGIRGIRGMLADDGILIRPLLHVSRADIDEYIERNSLAYVEDSTNSDTAYRRNFIRHEVVSRLRSVYSNIDENIMRLSRSAREDDEYLMQEAVRLLTLEDDKVTIDTNADKVLLKRAFYRAFLELGVTHDIEERHYNLLLDLILRESGTSLDMPFGIIASNEYGKIVLHRAKPCVMLQSIPFNVGDNYFGEYNIHVEVGNIQDIKIDKSSNRTLYVDAEKLTGAIIRSRTSGDVFHKFKGGRKKLKDYFIDIKLPQDRRDLPLIMCGNEVLVVPGIEIANDVQVTKDTHKIYIITLRRR